MMMAVRTKVAISESTPLMPTFAKIAVSAANTADKTAQKNQGPLEPGATRALVHHESRHDSSDSTAVTSGRPLNRTLQFASRD